MIRTTIQSAALLALLCLGACSDDETTSTSTQPTLGGTAATVLIDDMDFQPNRTEISVGETVTWSFDDDVDHDVEFDDGPASPIQRNGTWERTFDAAGTYDYVCTLHPSMTGTVVVTD